MSKFSVIRSPQERRALLRFARETAGRALGGVEPAVPVKPAVKGRFGGAFVTLWRQNRQRGCVGTFAPTGDIASTVEEMTRASLRDSRFAADPITAAELEDLEIEISILSDSTLTRDPLSLIPGVHGIIIERGQQSGCFLPKVATDRGWSAVEFLSNCCTMKAGLPADAWRMPDATVRLFEAEVFSESRLTEGPADSA